MEEVSSNRRTYRRPGFVLCNICQAEDFSLHRYFFRALITADFSELFDFRVFS